MGAADPGTGHAARFHRFMFNQVRDVFYDAVHLPVGCPGLGVIGAVVVINVPAAASANELLMRAGARCFERVLVEQAVSIREELRDLCKRSVRPQAQWLADQQYRGRRMARCNGANSRCAASVASAEGRPVDSRRCGGRGLRWRDIADAKPLPFEVEALA